MGRDVVTRHGSVQVKHYDGARLVSTKVYPYNISMPPVLSSSNKGVEEDVYGVELVTSLTPLIKLYTTHMTVSHLSVEMMVIGLSHPTL